MRNRWRNQKGVVVTLDQEGFAVLVEAGDLTDLKPGQRLTGADWNSPAKAQRNLKGAAWTLEPGAYISERLTDMDYRTAIRDVNAQGILKTFIAELYLLVTEYDMQDTIFGEKVDELMKSYYADMEVA